VVGARRRALRLARASVYPLGAVLQYVATARMATSGHLADGLYVAFDYGIGFLRVLVLLALWRSVLPSGEAGGMTLAALLTYTVIAEAFGNQLSVRTGMDNAFWNGSIATYFLRPHWIVGGFAAEAVGKWTIDFILFSLPLLLISPLLGVNPLPVSPIAGGLFLASLLLGCSIGFALEFLFGALTVALEQNVWAMRQMRGAVEAVLSGVVIPLALLPWGLGAVFAWLPFASMASAPLRIYTGTGDPLTLLLVQLGWSIVLWPLAGWLWQANRERVVGYGG
jgi:ABC-2 type transport system permease protein